MDHVQHDAQYNIAQGHQRRRTPTIAIKGKPQRQTDEMDMTISFGSSERMYDQATWRMYYRIADHRRRNPLKENSSDSLSDSSRSSEGRYPKPSARYASENSAIEDGVFDMEL